MSIKKLSFIIIALGVLVYANSLFGSFINDDNGQIVNNKLIHSLSNLPSFFQGSTFYKGGDTLSGFFYRPLFVIYFSIIVNIFGTNAFWFHFFQLILHILNALLLFLILKQWFTKYLSFFLSAIFLVHPMNVEAVSFISSSGTVLFCFFGLTALTLLIHKKETPMKYALIGLFLFAAALSQESGLLFIPILFVYKLVLQKKGIALYLISSFLAATFYFILRFGVANIFFPHGERTPILMAEMSERLINIPKIILFYLGTFVFPLNLGFYQIWLIRQADLINFYIPTLIVLALSIVTFIVAYKLYLANKKKFRVYGFFLAWMVIGSVLLLQIIPAELTVAERWFYLPMMGILGMLGITIQQFGWEKKRILVLVLILVVTLFGIRSFIRNLDWNNGIVLYSHDLRYDPNNYALQTFLGTEYAAKDDYDLAVFYLEKSSANQFTDQHTLNNLAKVYYLKGDIERSKETLRKSIQQNETVDADENLAYLMVLTESPAETEEFIKSRAERIESSWKLWLYYAIVAYNLNKVDEARFAAEKAHTLFPNQDTTYVHTQIINNQPIDLNGF